MGLSVNQQSSIHYPWARKQASLFSLGNGRYRTWDPEQDGNWVVTNRGARLVVDIEEVENDEINTQATALSFERDLEKSLSVNKKQLEAGLAMIRLYDLRHTCTTLLLSAGENPKVVSERLGHASVTLTMDTYSHVLPDMQEAATKKLEDMLFK